MGFLGMTQANKVSVRQTQVSRQTVSMAGLSIVLSSTLQKSIASTVASRYKKAQTRIGELMLTVGSKTKTNKKSAEVWIGCFTLEVKYMEGMYRGQCLNLKKNTAMVEWALHIAATLEISLLFPHEVFLLKAVAKSVKNLDFLRLALLRRYKLKAVLY